MYIAIKCSRAIVNNRDLLPETPVGNLLYNDFWGTPLTHSGSHRSYRPLCVLSFRLNYAVSQLSSGFSYHLVNVLLHMAVCPLYMAVCLKMLPRPTRDGFTTSLVAGLLFAVHPIHTEAVAGLVGRADVGSALFFLLAFYTYLNLLEYSTLTCTKGLLLYMATIGFTVAAMFTKEIGITVLGVCLMYDVLVHERVCLDNLLQVLRKPSLLLRCAALTVGGLALLFVRMTMMGGLAPSFSSSDNPAAQDNSTLVRMLTFTHLPPLNGLLLLCPAALSFDWSMDSVPLVQSIADGRNAISIVFYGLLLAAGYRSMTAGKGGYTQSALVCSLLILIIPFLPASNLLFYVGFVLAERILYIPSMGYCLLVAIGLRCLWNHKKLKAYRRIYSVLLVMVLVTFAGRSWLRNADWRNEESLYRSGIKYNPAKAWGNLANVLKARGDIPGAIHAYRSALSHRGNMADAHYNLGVTLQEQKEFQQAELAYRNAIRCRPTLALAHLNLGITLRALHNDTGAEKVLRHCITIPDTGLKDPARHADAVTSCLFTLGQLLQDHSRFQESLDVFRRALRHAPPGYELHSIYNLLGSAYAKLGNANLAEESYRRSLRIKPDHLPAIVRLAQFLTEKKRFSDAEQVYLDAPAGDPTVLSYYGVLLCNQADRRSEGASLIEKGLQRVGVRRSPEILSALADCYRRDKKYDMSIARYKEAAEINPSDQSFSNLGAVYHTAGDYSAAEQAYRKALGINRNSQVARENLQKLKNSQKAKK